MQYFRFAYATLMFLLTDIFVLHMSVDKRGNEWVTIRVGTFVRAWELWKYYRALGYKE